MFAPLISALDRVTEFKATLVYISQSGIELNHASKKERKEKVGSGTREDGSMAKNTSCTGMRT